LYPEIMSKLVTRHYGEFSSTIEQRMVSRRIAMGLQVVPITDSNLVS